jgi:hypothetical protein
VAHGFPLDVQEFWSLPELLLTYQFGTVHDAGMIGDDDPVAANVFGFWILEHRQLLSAAVQAATSICAWLLASFVEGTYVDVAGRLLGKNRNSRDVAADDGIAWDFTIGAASSSGGGGVEQLKIVTKTRDIHERFIKRSPSTHFRRCSSMWPSALALADRPARWPPWSFQDFQALRS